MADTKNNKNSNSPALRFPGFTDPWRKIRLSEIATFNKGVGISKDQRSEDGNPCILYGELYTTYTSTIITDVISKTNLPKEGLIKSAENDVMIPSSGETAEDIATARCILKDNVFLGGDLNIIRLINDNGSFLSYQLNGVRKRDIAKLAQGVSVVHLYKESLKSLLVSMPSKEEQEKIAQFLSLIEERIATQRRLIEDLEKLKSAIAHYLFQQNAPIIHLGELASITNGNADVQDAIDNYEVGLYPFFDRSEQIKYLNRFYLDKAAIIYAGEGQNFLPRYFEGKFALHQRCYAIYDFDTRIIPRYCYHYMHQLNKYFQKTAVGSTVASLRMENFLNAPIKIPSISTQAHIINVLDSAEHKVRIEQQLLSNFIIQRRYLLGKLFI